VGDYVGGPLFLVKPGDRLPPGELTVSHCLAAVAPDTWAIEWVAMSDPDRTAAAARCGIAEDQLPAVVPWATERFANGFAWPHAFLDIGAAQEFRHRFLPAAFRLLQIALPEHLVPSFLALAAPPPQQPCYAPTGASSAYEALRMPRLGLASGERRGFEVLGYERHGGTFHSFRCNYFERDFAKLGAAFNRWGLIDDEAVALKCAECSSNPELGTCADAWHPWLVVEHAT
jgi:hypothetical protein